MVECVEDGSAHLRILLGECQFFYQLKTFPAPKRVGFELLEFVRQRLQRSKGLKKVQNIRKKSRKANPEKMMELWW